MGKRRALELKRWYAQGEKRVANAGKLSRDSRPGSHLRRNEEGLDALKKSYPRKGGGERVHSTAAFRLHYAERKRKRECIEMKRGRVG